MTGQAFSKIKLNPFYRRLGASSSSRPIGSTPQVPHSKVTDARSITSRRAPNRRQKHTTASAVRAFVMSTLIEMPRRDVNLMPWNSSFRRQSKSTRRGSSFASPIGYAIVKPTKRQQHIDSYTRIGTQDCKTAIYLGYPGLHEPLVRKRAMSDTPQVLLAHHRGAPRPAHTPRPHPGDERRELPPQAEPLRAENEGALTLTPPLRWCIFTPPKWRTFTPSLTFPNFSHTTFMRYLKS